jgi:hypothetical protein
MSKLKNPQAVLETSAFEVAVFKSCKNCRRPAAELGTKGAPSTAPVLEAAIAIVTARVPAGRYAGGELTDYELEAEKCTV